MSTTSLNSNNGGKSQSPGPPGSRGSSRGNNSPGPASRGGGGGSSVGSRSSSRSKSRGGFRGAAKKVLNNNNSAKNMTSDGSQSKLMSGNSSFSSNDVYAEEGKRTTLHFIFLDGKKESVVLERRPKTYWDLQKVIITKKPNCKKMFSIRNEKKQFVTSANYAPQDVLYVKEFLTSINMKNHPLEEIRWEFYNYHAKPKVFHDAMEERQKLKEAAELEAKLAQEEEERLNAEFLKHKDKDINADLDDL